MMDNNGSVYIREIASLRGKVSNVDASLFIRSGKKMTEGIATPHLLLYKSVRARCVEHSAQKSPGIHLSTQIELQRNASCQ